MNDGAIIRMKVACQIGCGNLAAFMNLSWLILNFYYPNPGRQSDGRIELFAVIIREGREATREGRTENANKQGHGARRVCGIDSRMVYRASGVSRGAQPKRKPIVAENAGKRTVELENGHQLLVKAVKLKNFQKQPAGPLNQRNSRGLAAFQQNF